MTLRGRAPRMAPVAALSPALAAAPGLMLGLVLAAPAGAGEGHTVTTVDGMAYGPGAMPATPITDGVFTHVTVDRGLAGEVAFFNNGTAEPNIPGEKVIFGEHRGGLLSNGVPFNEHLHGGVVVIGQGALQMLAVVASDGPNRGGETYRVDARLNWRLRTDMALDPGFPQGLVVSRDLDITSGMLRVPPSLQTEQGSEGGFDQAADLPTGAPVFGSLGDSDEDGMLDGRIIGANRVPLDFLFVPGAPIVMSRTIVTDIPVAPRVSGILELAGVANLKLGLEALADADGDLAAYADAALPGWAADFGARAGRAAARLKAAGAPEAALAAEIAEALTAAASSTDDRVAYAGQLAPALARLEAALPELRATFDQLTETGSATAGVE
jgi:hypothetical protein